MKEIEELRLGLETAYIDGNVASNLMYKPQFVSNNYKEGKKVLSSIEDELLMCDQFQISVAFITLGGIEPLLQTLKELEKKHISGEILTTNYLNFSEPKALEKLNQLQNITLKMYDVEAAEEGFHTKGYIFKKEEIMRLKQTEHIHNELKILSFLDHSFIVKTDGFAQDERYLYIVMELVNGGELFTELRKAMKFKIEQAT